jgi:hypothetical protein
MALGLLMIYFDIREEDVNKLDLNQRLLNALPELMSFLNSSCYYF